MSAKDLEVNYMLIIYKIFILIFLFCLSFYFGYLPIKLKKLGKNSNLIGVANAFSGGIFLSIALLHLMPESAELFHDYFLNNYPSDTHTNFPYSYFLAFCGYTLILFIEKIIFDSNHSHEIKHEDVRDKKSVVSINSITTHKENNSLGKRDANKCQTVNYNYNVELEDIIEEKNNNLIKRHKSISNLPILVPLEKINNISNIAKRATYKDKKPIKFMLPNFDDIIKDNNNILDNNQNKEERADDYAQNIYNEEEESKEKKFKKFFTLKGKLVSLAKRKFKSFRVEKEVNEDFSRIINLKRKIFDEVFEQTRPSLNEKELLLYKEDSELFNKKNITSFLLLLALSVHSFFEGIALGLLDEEREIFFMLIAISFHKWVEALSIGINLNKTEIEKEVIIVLILMFSLTTPTGILCGMVLKGISSVFEAIFLSISAGTFLYISASEVVIEEFSVSQNKFQKFIGFLIGALVIFCFTVFEFFN